jgi:hypothetical protein
MVCEMLVAGGMVDLPDAHPRSHELESLDDIPGDAPHGTVVKTLTQVPPATPGADWRFVWIDRPDRDRVPSELKFHQWLGSAAAFGLPVSGPPDDELFASFARAGKAERARLLPRLRRIGTLTMVRYDRVLRDPIRAARFLAGTVWRDLDVAAAADAVHRRNPGCAPDMSFEDSV